MPVLAMTARMQVNILEAKNGLSQLLKRAQAGEDVVIANRGQPVARLVAVSPADQGSDGAPGDVCAWLLRTPLPAHARRSATDIDAQSTELKPHPL